MKILIVEDEMEIAKIIQTTLERESFDCLVAYDGLTALDLFQNQEPDLIMIYFVPSSTFVLTEHVIVPQYRVNAHRCHK